MPLSDAQIERLKEFESGLDPRHPERSRIPARVLGYGEISTVLEIQAPGLEGLALKRLPLFRDWPEVERYQAVFREYLRLLTEQVGLALVSHDHAAFARPNGRPVFYIVQERVPADRIGHNALRRLDPDTADALVLRILRELRRLWDYRRRQDHVQVAVDGQISNWILDGFDPAQPTLEGLRLSYLDTSTPLYRLDGVEQLDTELFLRSAPSFLVWVLRLLFVKDVVDRYYDFHRVAVDLLANFYKEQRPDLIPGALDQVNAFFGAEAADLGIAPVTGAEVRSYYREDAFIWRFYLAARKIDRTLRTRLLRREYPYILPERVQR
jgi:hypothetical protein